MKMKKSFFAVLLSIVFMFSSFVPSINVYASDNTSIIDRFQDNLYKIGQDLAGVIFNAPRGFWDKFRQFYSNNKTDYGADENDSLDDFVSSNYFYNNETGNNEVSVNLSNCIIDFYKDYIDTNTGYGYAYSYRADQFVNRFDTNTHYSKFLEIVSTYASDNSYIIFYNPRVDEFRVIKFDSLVYYPNDSTNINHPRPDAVPYFDWSNFVDGFAYSYNNGVYNSTEITHSSFYVGTFHIDVNENPNTNYNGSYCISNSNIQYQIYKSEQSMRDSSIGVQDYYITDSYNNYSHVSNTQNISQDTIDNSISYSNISNYVNSYYITNQSYPTTTQITQYINNYNGDNNGGGGGNGNGNGNGDDDDDNPFSWIGLIGDFISGLLSGIKGAIEGILDVLTSVVDLFLGEKDSYGNRQGGLPTIISDLIAYFLPFLPDWVPKLIQFSIIIALSLGIIRLIRGH